MNINNLLIATDLSEDDVKGIKIIADNLFKNREQVSLTDQETCFLVDLIRLIVQYCPEDSSISAEKIIYPAVYTLLCLRNVKIDN